MIPGGLSADLQDQTLQAWSCTGCLDCRLFRCPIRCDAYQQARDENCVIEGSLKCSSTTRTSLETNSVRALEALHASDRNTCPSSDSSPTVTATITIVPVILSAQAAGFSVRIEWLIFDLGFDNRLDDSLMVRSD